MGIFEWLICILLCVFGIHTYYSGWKNHQKVLSKNPCYRRYPSWSKPEYTKLKVSSKSGGGSLWKYEHNTHDKSHLNPYPVLFLHGHKGNFKQMRFLASEVQNNGTFQYFGINFQQKRSGYHSTFLLQHAAFTNEALRSIHSLYNIKESKKKKRKTSSLSSSPSKSKIKVMIVGHSIGGLTARVSVLLENHPRCLVNAIFMLSSPNLAPAIQLDPSLSQLTDATNAAWRGGYFNHSVPCQRRAFTDWYGNPVKDKSSSNSSSSSSSTSLGADWHCPQCVPKIRLVSLSGGSVDEMVSHRVTPLSAIDPFNRQFRMKKMAAPPNPVTNNKAEEEESCTASEDGSMICSQDFPQEDGEFDNLDEFVPHDISEAGRDAEDDNDDNNSSNEPVNEVKDSTFSEVLTPEEVEKIRQSKEKAPSFASPQLVDLRASQIKGVGFPCDHQAVLWCFQLQTAVTTALGRLAGASAGDYFPMHTLFDTTIPSHKYEQSLSGSEMAIMSDTIKHSVSRNATRRAWSEAVATDWNYVGRIVGARDAELMHATMNFTPTVSAYFVLCYLFLAACIFRKVAGLRVGRYAGLTLLPPWKHLTLDIILPGWSFGLAAQFPTSIKKILVGSNPLTASNVARSCARFHVGSLIAFTMGMGYTINVFFLQENKSSIENDKAWAGLYQNFKDVDYFDILNIGGVKFVAFALMWTAVYGLVLSIRAALNVAFAIYGYILVFSYSIFSFITRWTIWCKPIRSLWKKFLKVMRSVQMLSEWMDIISPQSWTAPFIFSISIISAVGVMNYKRLYEPDLSLGLLHFSIAVAHITGFAVALCLIVRSIFLAMHSEYAEQNKNNHKGSNVYLMQLVLMYTPAVVVTYPGLFSSISLLTDDVGNVQSTLALGKMFWWGTVCTVMSLWSINAHLWSTQWGACRSVTWDAIESQYGFHSSGYSFFSSELKGYYYRPIDVLVSYCRRMVGLKESYSTFNSNNSTIPTGSEDCCHEDGGKFAVFEQLDNEATTCYSSSKHGRVIVGSTYRVISCSCWRDSTMRDKPSEWCDWCRCRNCGVKVMPKGLFRPSYEAPPPSTEAIGEDDPEHANVTKDHQEIDGVLDLVLLATQLLFATMAGRSSDQIYYQCNLAAWNSLVHLLHHLLRAMLYVKPDVGTPSSSSSSYSSSSKTRASKTRKTNNRSNKK